MAEELCTDEYRISISREILVCKNMIAAAAKDLAKLEAQYGIATEDLVSGEAQTPEESVRANWLETQAGLLAWQERLREYEEAYAALLR